MESAINSAQMEVEANVIDSTIAAVDFKPVKVESEGINSQNKPVEEVTADNDKNIEIAAVKEEAADLPKKFDNEEFAYLKNSGFSSEIYKVEVKNLPKHYGYGEIKKLVNTTLGLECNKIKIPWKNSPFGFICFKNDEGLRNKLLNYQAIR